MILKPIEAYNRELRQIEQNYTISHSSTRLPNKPNDNKEAYQLAIKKRVYMS